MHIDDNINSIKKLSRRRVLLRESFRDGKKVCKRTIANITSCSNSEIEAIKIALSRKGNLAALEKIASGEFENGKIVAPVAALKQVADQLGITNALGNSKFAGYILWLILARLIGQGSRLSAVRLAEIHAGCEILGIESISEDILYRALDWLSENQEKIENRLFNQHKKQNPSANGSVYLYDVSSSYFEGVCNDLAAWGYNRDKKTGKMQVVYGLLADEDGEPLAIDAFPGNTKDTATFSSQIDCLKDRFCCQCVTLVGDKGMIRGPQQVELEESDCTYITAITKPEIRKLLSGGTLQMELFDVEISEIEDREAGIRYILRKNPYRSEQLMQSRKSKIDAAQNKVEKANLYLSNHPKAKPCNQLKHIVEHLVKLKIDKYVFAKIGTDSKIYISIDEKAMKDDAKLDGCYVIKTNLPAQIAAPQEIHDRYKDLSKVEDGFRTMKTGFLEVRPIYIRKENRTRAHLFTTMLAYKIERHLRKSWQHLNLTVSEGLEALKSVSGVIVKIGNEKIVKVPKLNDLCKTLTKNLKVTIPDTLPDKTVKVVTRKTIAKQKNIPAKMATS